MNGSASDWGLATTGEPSTSVGMEEIQEEESFARRTGLPFVAGLIVGVLGAWAAVARGLRE